MNRFKAFSIHFAISFVIFLILLYFILIQWYPEPLFSNDGGWRVMQIIIGVDLVLGPLLTLVVFKPGKPGLKFDLTMIALFQTVALSWGVWNAYNERPAALIYTFDYFTPVPAYQLKEVGIDTVKLKEFGDDWPVKIYSGISDISTSKLSDVLSKSISSRKPIYLLTEYYSKFSKELAPTLKESSMNLEKYVADKPKLKKLYQRSLVTYADKTNTSYLGLHSRDKKVTAIYDLDTMKILGTIDIQPSKYTFSQKIEIKRKEERGKRSIKSKETQAIYWQIACI